MKYSFNTWAFSSYPNWLPAYPIEEVIRRLSVLGYDAVELGCTAPHAWPDFMDKQDRKALLSFVKAHNMVFSTLLPVTGVAAGNVLECLHHLGKVIAAVARSHPVVVRKVDVPNVRPVQPDVILRLFCAEERVRHIEHQVNIVKTALRAQFLRVVQRFDKVGVRGCRLDQKTDAEPLCVQTVIAHATGGSL